ncbi:GAF domain-containing sensor histidine kinase [Aphanothece sacrum]|uniref:histidine kinase n=1 Tax=Aphanothece sacrum FPU1 TaxID=1920663 RepID=A0A401IHV0_APHSA|nr:GAF domain-containing sensor histidine kinase [Aphanothece sacrum]GBF80776.1 two-component sensor histidine kinase [Aphanothece sacrum FPU1]
MQVTAVDLGVRVSMANLTNRLFCRLDGLTPEVREKKRVNTIKNLGLLEAETIPVFDEATQTAARFLEVPVCTLGIMLQDNLSLKSVVGLSRLGFMNQLASSRKISSQEAFSTYVVDSEQPLIINDTLSDPLFARSILVQHYGIRAFLGSPLITADGQCIGTIAVMDLVPRQFTLRDMEFLNLTARWCLREFEREYLWNTLASQEDQFLSLEQNSIYDGNINSYPHLLNESSFTQPNLLNCVNSIKLKLLQQLIEELRSPLTSVIGMSSVLQGGLFGHLSNKQKEYLEIINTSGKQMNSLVQELLKLGSINDDSSQLQLISVNIEMLCQRVLNSLGDIANQKRRTLRLSVEPGKRIWLLDKNKVQQALYYLVLSILESLEVGGEIRIHVSRRSKNLNISIWVSHPWLGDGLPQVNMSASSLNHKLAKLQSSLSSLPQDQTFTTTLEDKILSASSLENMIHQEQFYESNHKTSQELLGLLLGCYFTESHGGKIVIQGSLESGYRYILMFPKIGGDEK